MRQPLASGTHTSDMVPAWSSNAASTPPSFKLYLFFGYLIFPLISFGFFGFPSIRYPSAICLLPTNLPTMWAVDDVNLLPATIAGLGTSLGGSSLVSCFCWAPTSLKDTHSMSFHLIHLIHWTSCHVMSLHVMSLHVISRRVIHIIIFLISFITSFILFMSFQFVWLACPFNSLTRLTNLRGGLPSPALRSHLLPNFPVQTAKS